MTGKFKFNNVTTSENRRLHDVIPKDNHVLRFLYFGGIPMEQEKLNPNWINRLLDTCEEVGVSKMVIERFIDSYITERGIQDAKLTTSSKGTKRTSN